MEACSAISAGLGGGKSTRELRDFGQAQVLLSKEMNFYRIFIGLTGKQIPLLSNLRVDVALLVLLGMAICMQGGIGRVAATNAWWHPLSMVGYLLGGLILLIAAAAFTGLKLPYIQGDRQALIVIAILAGAKVLTATAHSLLVRVS